MHDDQEGSKSMLKDKYILYDTTEGFFMVYLIRLDMCSLLEGSREMF